MKLVSVVVQAYNSADTIIDTLESVKAQTYQDIELIVTDDKSNDNTIEVVEHWLDENRSCFKAVKILTSDVNTGIPGSNNRALKLVTGEYVEFLAADDLMENSAIARYVEFCENNPDTIPISKVELFSDSSESDFRSIEEYCRKCYEFAKLDRKSQYRRLLIQNMIVAPAAAFYPTEIIRKLNGFDEAYRWMEDYPVNIMLLKNGYLFGLIDEKLIYYRISSGSITSSRKTPLKMTEAKFFFKKRFWYMFQAGMIREALGQTRYWIKVLLKK